MRGSRSTDKRITSGATKRHPGTITFRLAAVVLCVTQGLTAAVVPANEWLLDEGTGTAVYDTGSNANHGSLMEGTSGGVQGPQWLADPERGTVLSFDGADDYILTASQGVLGSVPRTVTLWFNLSASQYRHTLVEWGVNTQASQYFRLLVENNRLRFEVSGGNALALNAGTLIENQWYHAALVADDFNSDGQVRTSEVKFYLNGELVPQTGGVDQLINTVFDGDDWVRLGGGQAWNGIAVPREPLKGMVDNVRIYDVALSAADILDDMEKIIQPPPLLVHEWLFQEGDGVTTADTGSAENTGTLMEGTNSGVHGPRWVTDVQRGEVLEFDGDDWVLTDSQGILGSQARTVTAWFCLLDNSARHTLIQWGSAATAGRYFRLLIEARQLRFEVGSGNALALNSGDLALNTWYHVALAVDDFNGDGQVRTSEVKFYLNGRPAAQTGGIDQVVNTVFTDSNCYVRLGGAAQVGTGSVPREAMTGYLDDVRIYGAALSLEQICEDMNQPTAWSPMPAHGSSIPVSTEFISWMPGSYAQPHQVYFGTDYAAVNQATPADPRGVFLGAAEVVGPDAAGRCMIALAEESILLSAETTYYWRVDGLDSTDSTSPWKGSVWSFTTNPLDMSVRNLTCTANFPTLVLHWDPPVDAVNPLYDVVIAEDPGTQRVVWQVSGVDAESWQADVSGMVIAHTYYCRVEAYDPSDPEIRGSSEILPVGFKAPAIVEDFNAYTQDSELFAAWQDGTTNATGSVITLSYEADGQSMQLAYDNRPGSLRSEAARVYSVPQNWMSWGTQVLQFSFRGSPDNLPGAVYAELTDADGHSGRVYYRGSDQDVVQEPWSEWRQFRAELGAFAEQGVDATRINCLKTGVESTTQESASGVLYIDNVGLDIKRCPADYDNPGDFNRDCSLDLADIELLARCWLASAYQVGAAPVQPGGAVVYYRFDETGGSVVNDRSGGQHHGIVEADDPDSVWDCQGVQNGCINFDQATSVLLPDGVLDGIGAAFTISFWIAFDDANMHAGDHIEFSSGHLSEDAADTTIYAIGGTGSGWHHLCVTKDNSARLARIYWDGVIVAETSTAIITGDDSTIGISRLGSALSGEYEFLGGKMDEFRVFGRALTHAEVVLLYGGASAVIQQPLEPIMCPSDPMPDGRIDLADFYQLAVFWLDQE